MVWLECDKCVAPLQTLEIESLLQGLSTDIDPLAPVCQEEERYIIALAQMLDSLPSDQQGILQSRVRRLYEDAGKSGNDIMREKKGRAEGTFGILPTRASVPAGCRGNSESGSGTTWEGEGPRPTRKLAVILGGVPEG